MHILRFFTMSGDEAVYAKPAKNIAKRISSGNALVGDVKKHPSAVGCATHAPEVTGSMCAAMLKSAASTPRSVAFATWNSGWYPLTKKWCAASSGVRFLDVWGASVGLN